jgi:hypothetical protein
MARMAPLYRMEATKGMLESEGLERHDFRALALKLFDVVIERMGFGGGATIEEIEQELGSLITAAEPGADGTRVEAITRHVADALLNERERRRAFWETVPALTERGLIEQTLRFHYLQQKETVDGVHVFRATTEGINIYTGSLAHEIEDAQAAEEAVLRYQIGRGRIADAVVSARKALAISLQYEEKIRAAIDTVRRDVSQVDWVTEVLRQLDEALAILRERTRAETEIAEAVRAKSDFANADDRAELAELEARICECQQRHLLLHRTVMSANRSYLEEQARQAFRPRGLATLPDMEAQVLSSALCLPAATLDQLSGELIWLFSPPVPQPVCDLDALVEILLAPRRAGEDLEHELPFPDPEQIADEPPRFSPEDERFVTIFLEEVGAPGERLSHILELAARRGMSLDLQTLVALEVLHGYGELPINEAFTVQPAGNIFDHGICYGDDLILTASDTLEAAHG